MSEKKEPTLIEGVSATITEAVARERQKEGAGVVMLLEWLRSAVVAGEIDADQKVLQFLSLPGHRSEPKGQP